MSLRLEFFKTNPSDDSVDAYHHWVQAVYDELKVEHENLKVQLQLSKDIRAELEKPNMMLVPKELSEDDAKHIYVYPEEEKDLYEYYDLIIQHFTPKVGV